MCTTCVPAPKEVRGHQSPGNWSNRQSWAAWCTPRLNTVLFLLRASDRIIFFFIILRVTSGFLYCKFKSLLSNINSSPRFEFFDKSFPECTLYVSGLHYSAGLGRIGSSHSEMFVVCTNPLALPFVYFNLSVNEWFKQWNGQDSQLRWMDRCHHSWVTWREWRGNGCGSHNCDDVQVGFWVQTQLNPRA